MYVVLVFAYSGRSRCNYCMLEKTSWCLTVTSGFRRDADDICAPLGYNASSWCLISVKRLLEKELAFQCIHFT